jgi:hypothetical protein
MTTSILIYILAGIIILVLIWVIITEYRFKKFFAGTKAVTLEDAIIEIGKKIAEVKETQTHINNHLLEVDKRLDNSIRNVQTIRFNPFDDAGSNQSFALSFLNDKGDGVVISSLYARDRMSIFAKPILNGKSDFELSIEEKEVLKKSL